MSHPSLKPGNGSREKLLLVALVIKRVGSAFDYFQLFGTRRRCIVFLCSIRHYLGMSSGNNQQGLLNFSHLAKDVEPAKLFKHAPTHDEPMILVDAIAEGFHLLLHRPTPHALVNEQW